MKNFSDSIVSLFEKNSVYFSSIFLILAAHIYDVLENDHPDMIIYDTAQAVIQFPILLGLVSLFKSKLLNIQVLLLLLLSFVFDWFELYHFLWEGFLKSFYWDVLGFKTENTQFGMITIVVILAISLILSNTVFYKRQFFKLFSFIYLFGAIITTAIFHFFIIETNYKPFLHERVAFIIEIDESGRSTDENCDLINIDCLTYEDFKAKYTGKYDQPKIDFVDGIRADTLNNENHKQYIRGFDPKFQSGGTNYFVYFSKTNNEIKIIVDKDEVAKRHQRYFQSLYGLIAAFNFSWMLLFIYLNHLHQRKFIKI